MSPACPPLPSRSRCPEKGLENGLELDPSILGCLVEKLLEKVFGLDPSILGCLVEAVGASEVVTADVENEDEGRVGAGVEALLDGTTDAVVRVLSCSGTILVVWI